MDTLGAQIRKQRRRLGLTLDELAARTSISKPYLSLIETGRVANPPSDQKLTRLEEVLGFASGHLLSQAHLQRTPRDVRAVLARLVEARTPPGANGHPGPRDLDAAYLSGALHEMVERLAGNIESVPTAAVPVVNRVAAGYPSDFTDLSYPRGVADQYLDCPPLGDADAFAARVHGDSMTPKYREGDIVVFSPTLAPRSGDDCFVRFTDGMTTFKRVFFESDDKGNPVLRLQPRNERYRPQIVPAGRVGGLYRAVYRYERV